MSAPDILRRLLRGTGLRAVPIGAGAYRIEHVPQPAARIAPAPVRPAPARPFVPLPLPEYPQPDLIVTAQKRPQALDLVAIAVTVVPGGLDRAGIAAPGSQDIALATEGLSMTNLGPGRNRQFIRGIADSPFNGPSQTTVSVQLDEARVTFDAPDPDLRLIDVDRVEILKGPQGPLYGSGALGGIYHIVTRKPDLADPSASMRLSSEVVQHGGVGGGGEAVLNWPVQQDRLAVRAVGYAQSSPGWIDNIGRRDDANESRIYGGRLAIRWRPDPDWTVDLGGTFQNINVRDSQYVLASDDSLARIAPIAEPNDNDFRIAAATVEGRIGALRLLSSTSYVDHSVDYRLDASAAAADFGLVAPIAFDDNRHYTLLNQELRLSDPGAGRWLAGLSYLLVTSHDEATMDNGGDTPLPVVTLNRKITEYAAFGEVSMPLLPHLDATVGARLFQTIAEDETMERAGSRAEHVTKTILSPSIALSHRLPGGGLLYLRYARAMRPGGLTSIEEVGAGASASRRFDADELGTIDLGIRRSDAGGRLSTSVSLYHTAWDKIQSDFLLSNGLVSTRNAGKGSISGIEAETRWTIGARTSLSGGFTLQNARLTRAADGLKLSDRRLPIAPDITARLQMNRSFTLGPWQGTLSGQANYIGSSRLALDDDLDRKMGDYAIASTALSLVRGALTLGMRIDNLFDIEADSFAFGNPFSIRAGPQYTPLRPRTLTLSVGRRW